MSVEKEVKESEYYVREFIVKENIENNVKNSMYEILMSFFSYLKSTMFGHVPSLQEVRVWAQIMGDNEKDGELYYNFQSSFNWETANGRKIMNWRSYYGVWRARSHEFAAIEKKRETEYLRKQDEQNRRKEAERMRENSLRGKEGQNKKVFNSKMVNGVLCFDYDWYLEQIQMHGEKVNGKIKMVKDERLKTWWTYSHEV